MLAGPFLAVVGSRSRVAVEQVEAAVRTCHGLRRLAVDPAELSLGPRRKAAVGQAIAEIFPHLSAGGAAVVTVRRGSSPGAVLDPASITDGLGEITGGLAKAVKLRTLFLTGGDTVAGVCRGLAARALAIEGELAPGIHRGRIYGGPARGARVITKAGSFGDELSLARNRESPEIGVINPLPIIMELRSIERREIGLSNYCFLFSRISRLS